ncbi:MAG: monovalent cation/H+ antiporter complex subunit F [Caldilineaceae bacterium]
MNFGNALAMLMTATAFSMALCFVRLAKGPTNANRAVAFDLISVHAVGLLVLAAIRYRSSVLLDAAIVTTVLGFLGNVMLARMIESAPFGTDEL